MLKNYVNILKSYFILMGCVIGITFSSGQNKNIDSLLTLIKTDKADSSKVNHLTHLSDEFKNVKLYDTAVYFGNSALQLAKQLNFKNGIAYSYLRIGTAYHYKSNNNQTIENWLQAIKVFEELKNKKQMSKIFCNLGLVYINQGSYPKALDSYLKALKINEELIDKSGIVVILGNIGQLYYYQKDYPKSLDFDSRAVKMAEELGQKVKVGDNLLNIGNVYFDQKQYSIALSDYFKALKLYNDFGEKNRIAACFQNIGNVYTKQINYNQALNYFFRALKISKEIKWNSYIADCYTSISIVYKETGKFKEAEEYLKKSIVLQDSLGFLDDLRQTEENLSQLYDTIGQYKDALIYYKKAIALKDTIFSQENRKQLVRKEMNYEFDKKETAAKAEQDKKDAVGEAESKKQKIILGSTGFGLLLVIVFAGFVFRSLRITRKQKNIIELQKNEVSAQKDIAEDLRDLSEKQKHIVEEKQKEIIQSITYAKRIQTALLTSDKYINTHLPAEHFILFKPKDIVSGDFYWALSAAPFANWDIGTNKIKLPKDIERQNIFYLITADCTGHGVPGAFMSMLNISYLNENVIERSIRLPHDILNAQRKEIIQALNPEGSIDESKDGMDCILCAYDFDKMLLHFASANNPLWRIREGELTEYKADKMPVGKYSEKMESFTLNTIELQKGDIIYTSTDGFADQFGTSGKKLMKKKFKEELVKIHHQPMAEQKIHLNQFFESWKGNTEQVDDVTIIGVRI